MKFFAANILLPLSASICLGWTLMDQSPSNKNSKAPDSKNIENSAAAEQRLTVNNLIVLGQSAPP